MLEIRTLGGLTILDHGKQITSFDQRKVPALLVYLAATGQPHPREILAEFFWEERPKPLALAALRVALVDLRKTAGHYVTITRDIVSIDQDSAFWLDAAEFDRLAGDSSNADQLATAINIYNGGFLDGFSVESYAFDLWTTTERERLHIRMTNAFDCLIEHQFQHGDYAVGIDNAIRFLGMEPEREKTYYWLMKLMACCGEREKALEYFAACCEALSRLNLLPSPATLELYERIRSGDDLHPPTGEAIEVQHRPATPQAQPGSILSAILIEKEFDIPARAKHLVGRDTLLNEIDQSLDQEQRVLLQGFAGIGKTALAAEVLASHISCGDSPALWLDLGHDDADTLLEALVRPLDGAQAVAASADTKDQVVRNLLNERNIRLVVYDNAWNGPVLERLINACPRQVTIVATSRHRYPVSRILRVQELALDDALVLLNNHTYQAFTRDDAAAVELCKKLGCHPLAIEIAGKTMQVDEMRPDELLRRIGDAPNYLPDPMQSHNAAPVATLIATSLEGLDPIARDVFYAFGALFTTTATPDLVALYMALDQHTALSALETLNQRGLAERYRKLGDTPVFRVHDLAHAYARSRVTMSASNIIAACANYTARHSDDLHALDAEIGNLIGAAKAAHAMDLRDYLLEIIGNLTVKAEYFKARGYNPATLDLIETASAYADSVGQLELAHNLYGKLGDAFAQNFTLFEPAIEAYEQALRLTRAINNPNREVTFLTLLGTTRFRQGADDASAYYDQAYALASSLDDPAPMIYILSHRSFYEGTKQPPDFEKALRFSNEAAQLAARHHLYDVQWAALVNRGIAERELGRLDEALDTHRAAIQLAREQDNRVWEAQALFSLAKAHHERNEQTKAAHYLQESLTLCTASSITAWIQEITDFMQTHQYPIRTNERT
jgi:DNA-binding SARP family transcriptional activator